MDAESGQPQAGGTLIDKGTNPSTSSWGDSLPPGLAGHPDYEIKRELDRGGMGVVYLAHNRLMGRDEVLKVMGQHLTGDPGLLERFLREIRSVAKLRHPNIVTAHHATRFGQSVIFAMEYVEGLDLSKLVKTQGPAPVADACLFIHQAALGLQHAHERGLVHRDITPRNLMLSREGNEATVKILDFGLAKAVSEEKVEGGVSSTGQALGTPDYSAPEQIINAKSADIRADIYSLGGTLYYLLAGRPPFQEKSLYDLYQAHISRIADPLDLVRPEVPAELAALVAKMMAKGPSERFQTPGEVARALVPFLTPGAEPRRENEVDFRERERSVEAAPDVAPARKPPPPSVPKRIAAASLFAFIFIVLGIVITIKTRNGETTITVPDDTAFRAVVDGKVVVEHKPSSGSPPDVTQTEKDKATTPSESTARKPGPIDPKETSVVVEHEPSSGTPLVVTPPEKDKTTTPSEKTPRKPEPIAASESTPRKPEPIEPKEITNALGMKLVLIPAGEFLMGSPDDDKDADTDEKPQHRVRITRPFYLGATEVTQGQYRAVMGQSPSYFKGSDDLPVEQVSWFDAVEFCNALSVKERLTPYYRIEGNGDTRTVTIPNPNGEGYRLPTEAEWEYGCRAGNTTRYSFGDDAASLGEFAWYDGNSANKTHPVGEKRPNAWNLYDMHGNVWEWCQDWYDKDYYGRSIGVDPPGPAQAAFRVDRGGSWCDYPPGARSANRLRDTPGLRYFYVGFRVARVQSNR